MNAAAPRARPPSLPRRALDWTLRLSMLLAALVIAGCNFTQLVYNRLDWVVGHELDRYVTLSKAQERLYRQRFVDLWTWHRRHELPRYAQELRQLTTALKGGIDEEQALAYTGRYVDEFYRVLHLTRGGACALLATLSDEQVADVLHETQRDLDKYAAKYVKPGEADVRSDSERKEVKSLQRWLGSLDAGQRAIVHRWATQRPFLMPDWLEFRRAWRAELGEALAARTAPDFCDRIGALLDDPAHLWSPRLRQEVADNQRAWARMLAELSATLSPRQRQSLTEQLDGLAADFEQLARQ